MQISIRDAMVLAASYDSFQEGCNDLGVEYIELELDRQMQVVAPTARARADRMSIAGPDELHTAAELWSRAGLIPASFLMANNFGAADLQAEIDWLVRAVDAAEMLGMRAIRIDAIMTGEGELPLQERIDRFAGAVRTLLERTAGSAVSLGIENHGRQGNDPVFLRSLISAVDSPRMGLTIDTGNFYWSGKPLSTVYSVLEELAPYARHTHCKNIAFPADEREKQREVGWGYGQYVCPLPDGDIDHRKVVGFLQAAAYSGDLCVEDESMGKFDVSARRDNLRRSMEYLRSIAPDL